jgi:5-methylcytosine-specific restriction endonuclease McrA
METKLCRTCDTVKPVSEFARNRTAGDGLQRKCKVCQLAYRVANRERLLVYFSEYGKKNRERIWARKSQSIKYQARKVRYNRERYWANPEKLKADNKAYRDKNRDQLRQKMRERRRRNPELWIQGRRNRRARLLAASGRFTLAEWRGLKAFYHYRCLRCGKYEHEVVKEQGRQLCADHIVPLACGGTNDISNIQPLCSWCNSAKGTKTIDYRNQTPPEQLRLWAE